MSNVYEFFAHGAASGGTFIQDATGRTIYDYCDFDSLTARYANLLVSRGVAAGDRVMVQVDKSPTCLLLYFACLRAGAIYLPLNTAYREDELAYFIENAEPALIFCDPSSEARFKSLTNTALLTLDGSGILGTELPVLTDFSTVSRTDEDIAVIIYTSGTTGRPKGAMITHGNIRSNASVLSDCWQWQPDDVMLHALPIYHVHGLFVATHLPVMNGSTITFLPRFDPDEIIRLLPESTVYMGVPTNYTRLLDNEGLTNTACRNMRLFTSGSAPLLTQTFDDFRARTGHTIVERYGMSETGMNTSNPLSGAQKAGTVGLPLEGISIRIADEEDTPVAETGTTGHLQLKGENVFRGYWRMPEKTAEEFTSDGYFRTGDLAALDDDGYVSIVGRNKDLIITGGLNVYPKEIESVIDDISGVSESAVIGLHDPDWGEAVSAVVVPDGSVDLGAEQIVDHLKSKLANFKVTKHVFFVTELPRNAMGKVQKNLLRERFGKESR